MYEYLEKKGVKPTVFEKDIGFSSGYLSVQKKRDADIGESVICKIHDYCHDLSIEWLLFGKGEMFIAENKAETEPVSKPQSSDSSILLKMIADKDNDIKELNRKIGQLEAKCEFLESKNPTVAYPLASEHELTHHYKRKK